MISGEPGGTCSGSFCHSQRIDYSLNSQVVELSPAQAFEDLVAATEADEGDCAPEVSDPSDANFWRVVPGQPNLGSLMCRLKFDEATSYRMPRNLDPWSPDAINIIETWIENGAPTGG